MTINRRAAQQSSIPFEGASMLAMVGAATGSKMITVGDLTVAPGRKSVYHIHPNTEESIFVVEGEVEFRLDGHRFRTKAGDCVLARRGLGHGLENVGSTPARMITVNPHPSPEREVAPDVDFKDGPPDVGVFFRDEAEPIEFAPGVSRYEMVGDFRGAESTYFSELTFQPGTKAPVHYHPAHEESMFCLDGRLSAVYAEDDDVPLDAGDIFTCEPTVRHTIGNTSDAAGTLLAIHPVLNPPPRVEVD